MSNKIEAFNIVADSYDDWYKHPQGQQVFGAEKKALEKMLPEKGLGIEIGAGTGIFANNLKNDDRIILSLDPSLEMIKKSKERGLYSILGLGNPIPIRKRVFDFSYMVTVLEFIPQPVSLLREIKEVSKPGAPFVVLFINSNSSWGDLYRKLGSKGDPVFKHAKLYKLSEVIDLLSSVNFKIIDSKGTLNSSPINQNVDQDLIEPTDKSGVFIVKAK